MRAEEFLDTADLLLSLQQLPDGTPCPPSEADRRTAASRAYYAAFLTVRDELATAKVTPYKGREDHGFVRRVVKRLSSMEPGCKDLRQLLDNLSNWRNTADYDMIAPQFPLDARTVLLRYQEARRFVADFQTWVQQAGSAILKTHGDAAR